MRLDYGMCIAWSWIERIVRRSGMIGVYFGPANPVALELSRRLVSMVGGRQSVVSGQWSFVQQL